VRRHKKTAHQPISELLLLKLLRQVRAQRNLKLGSIDTGGTFAIRQTLFRKSNE
jgi:hypothetical protein